MPVTSESRVVGGEEWHRAVVRPVLFLFYLLLPSRIGFIMVFSNLVQHLPRLFPDFHSPGTDQNLTFFCLFSFPSSAASSRASVSRETKKGMSESRQREATVGRHPHVVSIMSRLMSWPLSRQTQICHVINSLLPVVLILII